MNDEPYDLESVQDQYEDSAITLLVNLMMQEEGGRYLEESKRFEENHSFGVDLDKQALKTIDRHFSSIRRKEKMAVVGKAFSHVAKVFLIVFLIFSITFTSVSAFRDVAMNFVVKTFDHSSTIVSWLGQNKASTLRYAPSWLPDNSWELVNYSSSDSTYTLEYKNADGDSLNILMTDSASGNITIDTENTEIRTDILINKNPSIMSIDSEAVILSWEDESRNLFCTLVICGSENNLDPQIAQKIAESIK
jgi:hypothetical protein